MKKKFLEKISHYQFVAMVVLAVIIAVLLTSVSILVYVHSGAINIDLSRPGYEKNREETSITDTENQFQTSGPIDQETVDDFNNRLQTLQDEINSMNNFSNKVMSDKALNITEGK